MSKQILRDLPDLLQAGVIDEATAERIRQHYQTDEEASGNRLMLIFGVFGALLVGLGLLLLVAHNWDQFTRPVKLFFAFVPLLLGQGIAAWVFFKKQGNRSWSEGAAVFWILTLGACLSLITQIYHIEGRMSSFLLTWILLGAPIVYLLRSSLASLMYLFGITWYAASLGYFESGRLTPWLYPALMLIIAPFYLQLFRNAPGGNFTRFHHAVIPLSFTVVLGVFGSGALLVGAYVALFGIFLLFGRSSMLFGRMNGYRIMGAAGFLILMLVLSFDDFWNEWAREPLYEAYQRNELQALILNAVLWLLLILAASRKPQALLNDPLLLGVLSFLPVYWLGYANALTGQVLSNVLLIGVAVYIMILGTRNDDLGQLNLGLLAITALIACRFFDMDLSFAMRGILFVVLGLGFFFVNYRILQKRKQQA